jgi:hypothetical protein
MRASSGRRELALVTLVGSFALLLTACQGAAPDTAPSASIPPIAESTAVGAQADLAPVKHYLTEQAAELKLATAQLREAALQYHALAEGAGFDYARLWQDDPDTVRAALLAARTAWRSASPGYERIEGIVAGVPSLADYDVVLDAGSAGSEGGDNVAPVDLSLGDGRTLEKPGNLFGVTESTLWGTFADYTVPGVAADVDGDGQPSLGDALPDAHVLLAGATELDRQVGELGVAAQAWEPTATDAFTALVVMVPTMSEYFASWKDSRFVAGDASTQRDFVAISRLADIQDILGGLQVVYQGVSPLVAGADAAQNAAIARDLGDLQGFVANVHQKEQAGQRYSPEEADVLGAEAQNRATAITGQIAQAAAQVGVTLPE